MDFNGLGPISYEPDEERRRRFRGARLRRGVYLLPTFFTVANMMCGYYAILSAFEGRASDFDKAAIAIGVAFLFDSLDGRVARAMGTHSDFGKELDSLADIVSFGIAPAFLAYAWGIRAAASVNAPGGIRLEQAGWVVGFFYLACCGWRLARFNIQGMSSTDKRYFAGMPTPLAASALASIVHFTGGGPIENVGPAVLWLLLMVLLGVLMTSTVRYYSFKDVQWTRRQPSLAILLLAVLVGLVVTFSKPVLLILACSYVAQGFVLHIYRTMRHRMASRHA
ncbi:MAG: CDP-diacylglycerol--serine O-phosphatidyltransferase [Candidatus Acidiferrales bacterium]